MVEEFDLNIEKILENGKVYHAAREIIANALDEQKLTETKDISICKDDGVWRITDYGRGLNYHHFTQNEKDELASDKFVDERAAMRTIAMWESPHPTNVMQKAQFIIEHFIKNVFRMLDGHTKEMIVAASRPAVIRHYDTIDVARREAYKLLRLQPSLNARIFDCRKIIRERGAIGISFFTEKHQK